jgi:hypothetical protein
MNALGKLCPICKKENEFVALICKHCGAQLEVVSTGFVAISEHNEDPVHVQTSEIETFINLEWISEYLLGIQVAGETQPLYVPVRKELVIGRTIEVTPPTDDFLDLSRLNAGSMGVSRRHVMIRRIDTGYEVIDLTSRNGTWLNAERLVPNRPYPFASGSQLRIGNMHLVIMYRPPKDSKKS